MKKVQVSIMGCAVIAALAMVSAPAQARADHGCGYRSGGYSGGYDRGYDSRYSGGYVVQNPSYEYSYQPAPVYNYGDSYRSQGYRQLQYPGYSHGHHEYSGSRSHSDRWSHESRHSSGHDGHSGRGNRHHGR